MNDFQKVWNGLLVGGKWWIIAVILFGALGVRNVNWLFLSKVGEWTGLTVKSIPQTEAGKSLGFSEPVPLKPKK